MKIATTFDLIKNTLSFTIAIIASYLLSITISQISFLIFGIIFSDIIAGVLIWIKDRFGL